MNIQFPEPGVHLEQRPYRAATGGYSRGGCRGLLPLDRDRRRSTLAQLKALRKTLFDPKITDHRGRIVKNTGDGALVEFGSVVDAVRCAVEIQRGMAEQNIDVPQGKRIEFRIGIHVGDIIIEDDDIFGDGVKIAARLEAIAEPGGVCMSNDAYRQVRGKVEIVCDDMGPQSLKNITEPMQAWRVRLTGQTPSAGQSGSTANETQALPLPDKPSIAVLPFQNLSCDPEQEYFADGMVEEIITALSRFKSLFVIARNSSFAYRGKAVDIKQVGRELGVRYVLEGSVRKAAENVRITGQLIETTGGTHLWADRFEGKLTDIFGLQDEVTEKVVAVIEPTLKLSEIKLAARRRPDNLSAYDLYLRALPLFSSMTRRGLVDCARLAYRALEIDPQYCAAAILASGCLAFNVAQGWAIDTKSDMSEATRLARLALSVDENDPETLAFLGRIHAYNGDSDTAIEMVDRAVALNPNSATAWSQRSWAYAYSLNSEEAVRSFERTIRLSPLDPMLYDTYTGIGFVLFYLGRFEEAVVAAKKAARQNQSYSTTYRLLAAALAQLGRSIEAKDAAGRMLELEPDFLISEWVGRNPRPLGKPFIEALRLAGLPE
jgi:adenylate cyclase